ncbi:nuclease A inhibitor family protein [Pontibacter chitinilyticus]|uniref:nuclease A inhibitor family protein n=1 Tax=Pontibacter chitinilyticus TaxID=2674989 RepID=UPI00321BCAE3
MKTKEQLQQELMQSVDGLLMHSEIEAPFEFVYIRLRPDQSYGPEAVAEWAGKPSGMKVQTKELEQFMQEMKGLSTDARWNNSAVGYQLLTDKLHALLENVKVYCITQIGTEVYMLGKAEDGSFCGLRTMVIHDEATIAED